MRGKLWLMSSFILTLLMSGCSQSNQHADLHQFMNEVRERPAGEIEPLPTFPPNKTFNYSAVAMRSPFEAPLLLGTEELVGGKTAPEPDLERKKEYLESFNFSSLSLVGSLMQHGVIWALVDDGEGGVHRVKAESYLGRNHGKITAVSESRVEVVEILPDGKGSWVERPRVLALQEKDKE